MKQFITYNETKGDTINGYGIQIHYSFTSFDKSEIDELREWCKKHINAGVVLEPISIKKEEQI